MWAASIVMMVCSWLSYVDRQILATLSVVILADTGLSTERYTEVVSAFSIAYMIGNPLWGSLLDYVGLRKGMLAAVAIWSVASASHSLGRARRRRVPGIRRRPRTPGIRRRRHLPRGIPHGHGFPAPQPPVARDRDFL